MKTTITTITAAATTTTGPPFVGWVDPVSAGAPFPNATTNGLLTFRGNPTRSFHGVGPVPQDPEVAFRYPGSALSALLVTGPTNGTLTLNDADQTINVNNVSVTDPNGGRHHPLRVTLSPDDGDASQILATYTIAAPGGSWGPEDDGVYAVNLRAGEVRDLSGNVSAAALTGTFDVSLGAVSFGMEFPDELQLPAKKHLIGMFEYSPNGSSFARSRRMWTSTARLSPRES